MINKEKPGATPSEKLELVQEQLGELPHQYDVEFVREGVGAPAVYVNYDFSTAITIEIDDDGLYALNAVHWSPDHAIDDEHFIGTLADADIAAQVAVKFAKDHESV
jgi:hypothetical protein